MLDFIKNIKLFTGLIIVVLSINCGEEEEDRQPEPLKLMTEIFHVSIYEGSDGAIDLTVTGGTEPYQYQWSHGDTTEDVFNLEAGEYFVTVTDGQSQVETDSVMVSQPDLPAVSFLQSPQTFESTCFQVGLGDLDDDGDLDAVLPNMFSHSQILFNDGSGHFEDSGQQLTQRGHGAGLGDLDNDGDIDLFIPCANSGYVSKIYFNDGNGIFVDSGQDLGDLYLSGNSITLIDIDTDGDLDACVEYYQRPYKIYVNDGQGGFIEGALTFPDQTILTWGDIDSDGDVDVFIKEVEQGYKIMLNDGHGNFNEDWQMSDGRASYGYQSVALTDIDGDNDIDAFIANGDNWGAAPSIILLNDGTGTFVDSGQELQVTKWPWLALGDLNGDGYKDVFISNFMESNQLWLNNGGGTFFDSDLSLGSTSGSRGCALGDLDNDGDLDIFVAGFVDTDSEIWFNQSH